MNTPIRQIITAFVAGLLFAVGLALGGMTMPEKIVTFFDFSRGLDSWDPSLAFVMGGGMLVYMPVFRYTLGRDRTRFTEVFRIPSRRDITPRLVGGAALFGVGWGLGGFCPGPALTSLGALSGKAAIVVASMLFGMVLFQRLELARQRVMDKRQPPSVASPSNAVGAR